MTARANNARDIFSETLRIVREDFPEAKLEMEAVIYDTNPDLDTGWTNADISKL